MKKIFAILLVCFLYGGNLLPEAYSDEYYSSYDYYINDQKNVLKSSFNSTLSDNLYKIDDFFKNINDKETLEKISKKLDTLENSAKYSDEASQELFYYLRLIIASKLEFLEYDGINEIISQADNFANSSVNAEITTFQKSISTSFSNILTKTNDYLGLKTSNQNGDIKLDITSSGANFGFVSIATEFKNLNLISRGSDYDGKTDFSLSYIFDLIGDENYSGKLSSKLNLISVEDYLYLKLDNFEYSATGELGEAFDKIKSYAKDNIYIKMDNDYTSYTAFNPDNVYKKIDSYLSNPLFKAYKQDGQKYYLIPTENACNLYYFIEYGSEKYCTNNLNNNSANSVYFEFVKSILEYGELYINPSSKQFGYEIEDDTIAGKFSLNYSSAGISQANLNLRPKAESLKNEFITFDYKKGQKLDFAINLGSEEIDISYKSTLNNGKISSIAYKGNIEKFTSEFTLANNKFSGKASQVYEYYDYYRGVNYTDGKFDLNIDGSLNSDNSLNSLDLNAEFKNNYKEYLLNYKLQNGVISGQYKYLRNGDEELSIVSNGTYSKGNISLNNDISYAGYQDETISGKVNFIIKSLNGAIKMYLDVDFKNNGDLLKILFDYDGTYKEDPNAKIETPQNYINLYEIY